MNKFQLYFVNDTQDTDTFDFTTPAELEQFVATQDDSVSTHHSMQANDTAVLYRDNYHSRSEYLEAVKRLVGAIN